MLHLIRELGETVNIGDDINVTILGVIGNQVRLGFSAPKEIAIHREEVYLRIKQKKIRTKNQRVFSQKQSTTLSRNLNHNFYRKVKH